MDCTIYAAKIYAKSRFYHDTAQINNENVHLDCEHASIL